MTLPLLAGVALALMGVGFLASDYLVDRRRRRGTPPAGEREQR